MARKFQELRDKIRNRAGARGRIAAYARLLKLRGKVRFSRTVSELKADR